MIIEMVVIIAIVVVGIFLANGVQVIGVIAGFLWSIKKYNQMMSYVERHAFDGNEDNRIRKVIPSNRSDMQQKGERGDGQP